MSKIVKRKKIKIKTLLIIILILLIPIVLCKNIFTDKPTNKKITEQKTKTNSKLDQLENIDKKIDFFNNDYIDRYVSYKKKNPDLEIKQVIKNVNMQLDYQPYENTEKAKNLNTEKILVNKHYYVESDYIPDNLENISEQYARSGMKLTSVAKKAFESMVETAKEDNMTIIAMSSYRSYDYQVDLYNRYVNNDGKAAADTYSGRPGHSEHQTGLAVDVYNTKESYTNFEKTKEFDWMQKHAAEFGFILRFPEGKENETGYQYESWHYRYVGKKIAQYISKNNITLEEYYATKIKDF